MTDACEIDLINSGVKAERAKGIREHQRGGGTADQLKERAKLEAARAEKRAEVNLARRVKASIHVQNAPDPVSGLQSLLVGTNKPFEGSRLSAESAILGYRSALISGFARDLGDNWKLFASRKLEREWVLELAELNAKQGGNPGRTGSKQALEIAESVKKLQDAAREAQNRHGADIQPLDRYIARTEHAPEVLEKMGKEGWKKLVYNTADLARTFGPDRPFAEIDEALDTMYDRLRLGRFHDFEAEEDRFVVATQNVARKVSESRVLQFSDPEKWYAYSRQASLSTVTERVLNDSLKASRNAGMMSVLGTNPEDNWARIFAGALERAPDLDTRKKLEGAEDTLKEWLKLMTGQSSATKISRKGVALAVQNWLTLQRTAKLGFLPFSQLADLATVMSELRYQGVDLPSRIFGPMAGYFRGKGSQQREVAQLVGGAIEGWISEINQRMDVTAHLDIADPQARGGLFTGALAKTQNFMFKVTGAQAMTDRAREASVYLMARYFGTKRGISFERLNEGERRIMSAYNIGKPEWEALNSAEWTNVQGDLFMTPHVVQSIPAERLNA